MNWLSLDHSGNEISNLSNTFDHCFFWTSKILRLRESSDEFAAMKRPSGDQRGEKRPTDPGTVVTFLLGMSSRYTALFGFHPPGESKTICFPSLDQSASSLGILSAGKSRCGAPP